MKFPSLTVLQHIFVIVPVVELAPRERELMNLIHNHCSKSLILVIVMIAILALFIFSYSYIMPTVATREMHLYATLIEQREKTEQAERKSMRKSDAFAKASHDIRAALAGIISWINFCKDDIHDALDIHATDAGTTRRSEIDSLFLMNESLFLTHCFVCSFLSMSNLRDESLFCVFISYQKLEMLINN